MELTAQTVPLITVIGILFTAAICFVYPILGMAYAKSRYNAGWTPLFMGAAIFVAFGIVLKGIITGLIISIPKVFKVLSGNMVLYAVIGSLLAGIFEESGRFFAFKIMKNKCNGIGDALAYGMGHGGIEAIMIVGMGMLNSFIMAVTVNISGADGMIYGLEGEDLQTVIEGINALTGLEAGVVFASGIERFVAMSFHVAASLLVYISARKEGYIWLYPLAILFHTVLNIPAGLYQAGILDNILITELLIGIIAMGICAFSYITTVNIFHKNSFNREK